MPEFCGDELPAAFRDSLTYDFLGAMADPTDRSSLRIQRYLESARRCQELAITVGSPDARAALREAARRWRDVAEQIEENERKRNVLR